MKFKQKPIVSAVALALMGAAIPAAAQQAAKPTETITVTGIRGSLEKSLETKRNADTLLEVITAEDIGKAPDKNIADAVSRVPGVTISSQARGPGGSGETDRARTRGPTHSLT